MKKTFTIALLTLTVLSTVACGNKKSDAKARTTPAGSAEMTNAGNDKVIIGNRSYPVAFKNVHRSTSPDDIDLGYTTVYATFSFNNVDRQIVTAHDSTGSAYTNYYFQGNVAMTYTAKCLDAGCVGYVLTIYITNTSTGQHEAQVIYGRNLEGALVFDGTADHASFIRQESAAAKALSYGDAYLAQTQLWSLDKAIETHFQGILY